MTSLDEAVRILPDAVWWIKADGVDVVSGLNESLRLEWSGDVDLNDGCVAKMHEEYIERLKFIGNIGIGGRRAFSKVQEDLKDLEAGLTEDVTFLSTGRVDPISVE